MILAKVIKNPANLALALICLSLAMPSEIVRPANANTITFSNLDTGANAFTGSETEEGFTYSGLNFVFDDGNGNSPSALGVGFGALDSVGDTNTGGQIQFIPTVGALLTFDSFQLPPNVGVNAESLTGVNTFSTTYSTPTFNSSVPIDRLILAFTEETKTVLFVNNSQSTPVEKSQAVPVEKSQAVIEPAAAILGLVTVGLGALSRKPKR